MSAPAEADISSRQKEHYERIHDLYEVHYYDPTAMQYRERFIYDVLLKGVDLSDCKLADLAAGSGANSIMLRQRFSGLQPTGFDISASAVAGYERAVGAEAFQVDLTKPLERSYGKFHAAIIIGGLHHCVADLPQTLTNIASLLMDGGYLFMFEPNSRCLLEPIRKAWYRFDPYFDALSESALDHDKIYDSVRDTFELKRVVYNGGPAFFLVENSMILRVPLSWKRFIAPPLLAFERFYNLLPGRFLYPNFLAVWEKRKLPK